MEVSQVFDLLNVSFKKFFSSTEKLSLDEAIVPFKGRVGFKQYIPKKHKRFGIKVSEVCCANGYTWSMLTYLGRMHNLDTSERTVTEAIVHKLLEEFVIKFLWTTTSLLLV